MPDAAHWLRERLSVALGVAPESLDAEAPLDALGLSSREAVSLAGEIEEAFGITVSATLLWEHPTVNALARFLAGDTAPETASPPGTPTEAHFALVGMGCRFPGAQDTTAYWERMLDSASAITEIPESRWHNADYYDPHPGTPGKTSARFGAFIDGVDRFDHAFFNISRREALRIDPAQRLLLETAWTALEDAAVPTGSLAGSRTGVFIGISGSEYLSGPEATTHIDAYRGPGAALSIAANRISYALDLRGPSVAVDTACASSLSALHLACQAMAAGECDAALVGGVNLMLRPETSIALAQEHMLSPDREPRPFDARANGYVRGEGCGVVFLKPLAAAQAAGDRIHAVVRGVATGHMGRGNGLGAPNAAALGRVIAEAHTRAGSTPSRMGYVEMQATAMPLGDAIEVNALKAQFRDAGPEDTCVMGTAKVHIGHGEAASGIAGLIRAVLCLRHGIIPAHRGLEQCNPEIGLEGTSLRIASSPTPWPRTARPRIAGVTAFGFGGTCAHAVLEEAPTAGEPTVNTTAEHERAWARQLLTISAKTPEALRQLAAAYAALLRAPDAPGLAGVCFTANTGRTHFAVRLALFASDATAMAARLQAYAEGETPTRAEEVPPAAREIMTDYLAGENVDWPTLYDGLGCRKVTLPHYPFARERCWLDLHTAPAHGGNGRQNAKPVEPMTLPGHLRLTLQATPPGGRIQRLQDYLIERIASTLGVPASTLDPDRNLLELGLDSLTATEVLGRASVDLDLVVYPREAFEHPTPARLATHLEKSLQRAPESDGRGATADAGNPAAGLDFFRLRLRQQRTDHHTGTPNPTAVFILSAPRSGSTLLRVMLAGHPQLFAPPELHLLLFDSLAERRRELANTGLDAGLVRALMELQNIEEAEARRHLHLLEQAALPVQQAYRIVQQAAAPRVLIDKSPTYAGALETLQRAERIFHEPKYIYLARHPYAVIDSLVRTRLGQLAMGAPDQPHANAEALWTLANHNIRTFLRDIPEERQFHVAYEELVTAPEPAMRAICTLLEVPFNKAVLEPYEGERMTGTQVAGVTGDPNFTRHEAIDPALADAWHGIRLPAPLGASTCRLARELGYELPHDPEEPASRTDPRTVFEEGAI